MEKGHKKNEIIEFGFQITKKMKFRSKVRMHGGQ